MEASGYVDRGSIGQRTHRATARAGHQAPAHLIIPDDGQQAAVLDDELLASCGCRPLFMPSSRSRNSPSMVATGSLPRLNLLRRIIWTPKLSSTFSRSRSSGVRYARHVAEFIIPGGTPFAK